MSCEVSEIKFCQKISDIIYDVLGLTNPVSRMIYENGNHLVEKWFNIFIRLVMFVTLPGLMFPTFVVSYYKYFTTDLGNDAFEMPYPIWLPINWRDPIKYSLAFCFQYSFAVCLSHIDTCTVSFVTASCWMLISLANDIKGDFQTFDENAFHGTNRAKVLMQLNEILEFQSDAAQLNYTLQIEVYFVYFMFLCQFFLKACARIF